MRGDDWQHSSVLDARDRAAVLWADRVTRNVAATDDEARAEVQRHFLPPELVELTLVIGEFAFLNRFNDSLWMDLDDGAPEGANLYIEPEQFRRYAGNMYDGGP